MFEDGLQPLQLLADPGAAAEPAFAQQGQLALQRRAAQSLQQATALPQQLLELGLSLRQTLTLALRGEGEGRARLSEDKDVPIASHIY